METAAYIILAVVAICWILAIIISLIAFFPYGLIGLVVITAFGLLFIKVLKDRMTNKEDDYYSNKIDK